MSILTPKGKGPPDGLIDSSEERPEIPSTLPIFPLKGSVLFPFTIFPVGTDEPKAIQAIEEAARSDKILGAFALKDEEAQVSAENLYSIGTAAIIVRMLKIPEHGINLIVHGIVKIRLKDFLTDQPGLRAAVEVIEEVAEGDAMRLEALQRNIISELHRMVSLVPYLGEELHVVASNIEDPIQLAYLAATVIKMPTAEKQKILETDSAEEKLNLVLGVLSRELEVLELGKKIQTQTQSEMTKAQREYYLRQQLKAIQEELGEVDERQQEVNELRKQITAANLPDFVLKEANAQLSRLEKIPPGVAEYHVIRTYLDWLIQVPWQKSTEDNLDLTRAKRVLDDDHYDLNEVKERILDYLAVRKLKQDMKGPILCFIGPPGVGKTSLGQSIARALGRKFIRMSLGGMRDEAEIRGHRRTYVGALPGRIIQALCRAESNNPVFMLDEIDKVGADFRGDPSSALLEVLDPEQNFSFRDHYLDLDFDLSKVMFITTGNFTHTIQPALQDRMEIINLSGYTEEEKVRIAQDHLIPKVFEEHGISKKNLEFAPEALHKLINSYTREAGVRQLERELAKVCRKVAREVAMGGEKSVKVTAENLAKFSGVERFFPEAARRTSRPGVATGLAWTQAGGEIIFVEAVRMPGKGSLTTTGHLGEVMQESAKAALSLVRISARDLNIDPAFFGKSDLHLHVPAGAIPKDGPSAGVAMTVAIASAVAQRPVRSDVAMTGEITLSGLVLPVGGIKEKVLAARSAGIKTVILPKRNEKDLKEIPEELKKGLKFQLIETVGEAIKQALTNAKARKSKKA